MHALQPAARRSAAGLTLPRSVAPSPAPLSPLPRRLDAKFALLGRVGHLVESLTLPHGDAVQQAATKTGRGDRQLVRFWQLFEPPSALRQLSLTYKGAMNKAMTCQLAALTGLTSLSLTSGRLPVNAGEELRRLPALASLSLAPDHFEPGLFAELLPHLTRLTRLSLSAMSGTLEALPHVEELPALRSLSLATWQYQGRDLEGEEAQAVLTAASAMRSFRYRARPTGSWASEFSPSDGGLQARRALARTAAACCMRCPPAALRCALRAACAAATSAACAACPSPLQVGGAVLQYLSWSETCWTRNGQPSAGIRAHRGMPSLQQLLDAALPATLPPLKLLALQCTPLEPGALPGCTALGALTFLQLEDVSSRGGLEAVLAALLPQVRARRCRQRGERQRAGGVCGLAHAASTAREGCRSPSHRALLRLLAATAAALPSRRRCWRRWAWSWTASM